MRAVARVKILIGCSGPLVCSHEGSGRAKFLAGPLVSSHEGSGPC